MFFFSKEITCIYIYICISIYTYFDKHFCSYIVSCYHPPHIRRFSSIRRLHSTRRLNSIQSARSRATMIRAALPRHENVRIGVELDLIVELKWIEVNRPNLNYRNWIAATESDIIFINIYYYTYIFFYISMTIYMIYIYTYIHIYIHTYVFFQFMYIYLYIYIYIYIYTYIFWYVEAEQSWT